MYLVLIPHCMTEILAKECKSGKFTVLALGTVLLGFHFINPRRACAARVTVVGFVCLCLSVKSHLTYRASVLPENAVTYSAGNEGQKICGDLSETTAFKSYAAKHERKSQYYGNYSDLPDVSFLRLTHGEGPEGTQRFLTTFSFTENYAY